MKALIAAIVLLAAAGCSAPPFPPAEQVSLDHVAPREMVGRFRESMPEQFRVMSSIVFEFSWNKVTALGVIEVDRRLGTFTAVAMTPLGLKLFELSGSGEQVTQHFVFEAFAKRGNASAAIGEDIRRIYFGLVPSADARVKRTQTRITFREQAGAGVMEHVFGGAGGFLIEKRYSEDGVLVWRASYHTYTAAGGKAFPKGMVFENRRYGYRLIVTVKEVLA